jgi:hypothetical protein
MSEKKQNRLPGFEQRFPVVLTTFAVFFLLAVSPQRIRVAPLWVFYSIAISMLLPMILVGISVNKTRWMRIEHAVILLFCFLGCVSNIISLTTLARAMIHRPEELTGLQLLSSSIAIWISNVLIFTLAYWQIDRGGPEARMNNTAKLPDWHFPAEDLPSDVAPGWRPRFIDYLFLGFCTATAFSNTEAAPLTHRAKILMMIQSVISLITIVVVGARAINILNS